jgi:excisionase family DNA binding protein
MGRRGPQWAQKQLFTTGEAADICRVSQQTIIRCFDSGRIKGFRVPGSRDRRILRSDLLRFMKANNIPTDELEVNLLRVLVVDSDDRRVRSLAAGLSADRRFQVQTARNGYDAGLQTGRHLPHVIVVADGVPDLDPERLCGRLRENADLPGTRVVVVTTSNDRLPVLQQAGAASVLVGQPRGAALRQCIETVAGDMLHHGPEGRANSEQRAASSGDL